ncbi:Imm49 family immunity protein [Corallococcus soli]
MRPTFAPLAGKNAAVALEELLPQVLLAPPRQQDSLRVSTLYRRLGIAGLLGTADPSTFFPNLFKSGRAFLHFLQSAPDSEKMTSRSEPFFDAIACRDDAGAAELAKHSRRTLATGKEYEEDFFYIRFLMDRFFVAATEGSARQWLDAWAALAPDDFRLAVCTALDRSDPLAFESALATAIAELLARTRALQARNALSADDAATFAHVSTEVLAWLELAERVGLPVERDSPLAPRLARPFQGMQLPSPDSWKTVESARAFEKPPVRP